MLRIRKILMSEANVKWSFKVDEQYADTHVWLESPKDRTQYRNIEKAFTNSVERS